MAEGVVDTLQAIHVDEEQQDIAGRSTDPFQLPFRKVQEPDAVIQSRELVVRARLLSFACGIFCFTAHTAPRASGAHCSDGSGWRTA
jgi:hypothetical protein